MQEEWRPVAGYNSVYEVSNHGRVLRTGTSRPGGKARLLKPAIGNRGYWVVALCYGSVRKTFTVHRLVAAAFLPTQDPTLEVNHIDGDKLNCHITNLEWVTSSGNIQHSYDTGLRTRKLPPDILEFARKRHVQVRSLRVVAKELGVDHTSLHKALGPTGTGTGTPKLRPEDIPVIRHMAKTQLCRDIAPRYRVSPATIWDVVNGNTWKHIP